MIKKLVCLISYILMCSHCAPYQFVEFGPAFIDINQVELKSATGMSLSQGIKDLWVYQDDQYLGTFPLPCRIPLSQHLDGTIKVYPGIRNYGILSRPEIYPMMIEYQQHVSLHPFDSLLLKPIFFYKSNLQPLFQEGFDSGNSFSFDLDSFPASTLIRSNENFREGQYAGSGHLTQTLTEIEVSTQNIKLTDATKRVLYLELDILSDAEIQIGLGLPQNNALLKNYFLTLLPTADWKKIYIPLHELLIDVNIASFQLLVKSRLQKDVATANFYLDNLKVLSLP